jgi:anti-anti-sigma regulatory factor
MTSPRHSIIPAPSVPLTRNTIPPLFEMVQAAIGEGAREVTVDLSTVSYIDLVGAAHLVNAVGALPSYTKINFTNPSPAFEVVARIAGLEDRIDIKKT